jgi:uncharacterized protein
MLTPASEAPAAAAGPRAAGPRRSIRAALIKQVTLWHWVSSGITLGGMLLFTVTGITLNHASEIPAEPVVQVREAVAPAQVAAAVQARAGEQEGRRPLPEAVSAWLAREFGSAGDGTGEWSPDELYVSLPRPGGDAWVTVDRATGRAHFEQTSRGWIAYVNDLHKGRHTGRAWSVYIDVLAVACLVFTFSGLILLAIHSAKRRSTWPLIAFSLLAPILVLMLFVHP